MSDPLKEAFEFLDDLGSWFGYTKDRERFATHIATLRSYLDTCTCWDGNTDNFEGPRPDCAVHGAVRALNDAQATILELQAKLGYLKGLVGQVAYKIHQSIIESQDESERISWLAELRKVLDHD